VAAQANAVKQMEEVRRRQTEIESEVPTLREQLQVSKVRLERVVMKGVVVMVVRRRRKP
jgi:hypothetical protein